MAVRAWTRGAIAGALVALACGAEPVEPLILVPEATAPERPTRADDAPAATPAEPPETAQPRAAAASSPGTGEAPAGAPDDAETSLVAQPGAGPGGADRQVIRLDELLEGRFEDDLQNVTPQRDRSGQTVGFAVSRLRPGGFAHGLGLRDGDVVHRVGGQPITTVTDMLGVIALPRPRDVDVDLTRDGRPMTLRYRLE